MFDKRSNPILIVFTLLCCGCERSDPLSSVPNRTATAVLEDKLIGNNARAICVTATARETCNSRQSEVYVEGIDSLNDVRAKWVNDDLVTVDVTSGTVQRMSNRSRDGRIDIRLNLNTPRSRIVINHPGGNDSVPLPRLGSRN
jgi:hypothetical protein